jgi:hypothetical protein
VYEQNLYDNDLEAYEFFNPALNAPEHTGYEVGDNELPSHYKIPVIDPPEVPKLELPEIWSPHNVEFNSDIYSSVLDVSPPFGKGFLPVDNTQDILDNTVINDPDYIGPPGAIFTTAADHSYNSSNLYITNDTLFFNKTLKCGQALDNLGNHAFLYGLGFLIIIAVLFNGLQFAVFRTKPLRKFAVSAYLSAVALSDSLALFSHIPRRWINVLYQTLNWGLGVTVYDTNKTACRGLTYFSYVTRFTSAWIIVAMAAERFIVSKDPYKRSNIRKPKTALQVLLGIAITSLAINSHVIFTWDIIPKETGNICAPAHQSEMVSLFLTVLSLLSIVVLPFIITLTLTITMLQNLQTGTWKLRPKKITVSAINKVQFEKNTIYMVSMITGIHCLLCVPFIITWVILLSQHFSPPVNYCKYVKTYAAKDITEIIYMGNCAVKFIFCVFCGSNIISYK